MRSAFIWVFAVCLIQGCASNPPPSTSVPTAEPSGSEPGSPGAEPGAPGADPDSPVSSPATEPPGEDGGMHLDLVWNTVDLGVSVPDAWRSCSADSECTLVVTTCCDQCNGGKAVAVSTSHAKDAEKKYPKQCAQTACTERGCFTRAACSEGRCVMQWQGAKG